MEWLGEKIKDLIKENNCSIVKLAKKTGVSRQTVNDWIKGQVPIGTPLHEQHFFIQQRIILRV